MKYKKQIISVILAGVITLIVWGVNHQNQVEKTSALGAFSDPFLSLQLAASPANGECLTTDGTNNDWASCSSGAGDITGGSSLGTGLNIFDSKSGATLRFNSISAGSNITLSTTTNDNTIVIASTASGGGSGTVSTSTNEITGRLSYWTSNSATPALLGQVATTTLTASSPLSLSNTVVKVGGSNSVLTLDTSGSWTGSAGSVANALTNGATLNGSSFNGSSAISDWDINLANPNTWTALQQFSNSSSTLLSAYSAYLGGTATTTFTNAGLVGVSSSTPFGRLSVNPIAGDSIGFVVGSSTATQLSVSSLGFGTTTLSGLNVSGQATSTSNVGYNITTGCYAVGGSCVGGGSGSGGSSIGWTWNGVNSLYMSTTTDDLLLGDTSTTSTAKLEVKGNIFTRDQLIVGKTGGNSNGSFYDNTITVNNSYITQVATSSNTSNRETGIWSQFMLNAASTANGRKYAILGNVETSTTTSANYGGGLRGVQGAVDHVGTGIVADSIGGTFISDIKYNGSMTSGIGVKGWIVASADGTYDTARALEADSSLAAGSTVTNLQGLYVDVASSGTVTNGYGVYVDSVSGTNSWGFYQNGTNNNYYNGNVGIGSTTPFARLSVHSQFGTNNSGIPLFQVASSTSAATTTAFSVFSNGNTGIGAMDNIRLSTAKTGVLVVSNTMPTSSVALSAASPFAPLGNAIFACEGCGTSSGNIITVANYGGGSPGINAQSARGTMASSTATQSGDDLYFMGGRGFGSTVWNSGSKVLINMEADENFSDSANGTRIVFETTPNGSTTRTERMRINPYGLIGIATTTPSISAQMSISSTTASQLALSAGGNVAQWAFRNAGGNLYLSTTTVAGTATTSISALEISGSGFGTTTLRGLNISAQATSTSNVGYNITTGCYAINNTCVGGGGASDLDGLSDVIITSATAGDILGYNGTNWVNMATSSYLLSTELDSMSELETQVGSVNILLNTEIDDCSELIAIVSGETGTCGGLVFSVAPSFTGVTSMTYSSSTIYSSFLTASSTNLIINGSSFNNLLGADLSNSSGALTVDTLPNLTGTLDINSGGTNSTSFTNNSLMWFDGTSIVSTSTFPLYVNNITATTTSATSTFLGDIAFHGEIMPDGLECTVGQILKKTGELDWDCAADADSGGSTAWSSIGDAVADGSIAFGDTSQDITGDTNNVTAIAQDVLSLAFTNDAATDVLTQRILSLEMNASTNGIENGLVIDNKDTDDALVTAIEIISAAGTITTAIDLDDPEIATALSLGANDISATNWSITGLSGLITSQYSSSTIYSSFINASSTNLFAGGLTFATSSSASRGLRISTAGVVYSATTTRAVPIFTAFTSPDTGGNSWFEPYTITATNDNFKHMVGIASSTAAKTGFYGTFHVPNDYNGAPKIEVYWTSPLTSGNAVFDFDYRAISGDDAESLDQATFQESITGTDAAPSAANERNLVTLLLTAGNFAAGDTVEYYLARDGADAADTLGSDVIIHDVVFKYSD